MFVDFLIRMEDVSREVLDSIDYETEESLRGDLIAKRIAKIKMSGKKIMLIKSNAFNCYFRRSVL